MGNMRQLERNIQPDYEKVLGDGPKNTDELIHTREIRQTPNVKDKLARIPDMGRMTGIYNGTKD